VKENLISKNKMKCLRLFLSGNILEKKRSLENVYPSGLSYSMILHGLWWVVVGGASDLDLTREPPNQCM